MSDTVTFVCVRVENMPVAGVASRRERCKECDAEVWMTAEIPADGYICVECAGIASGPRPEIAPHPLVREALRKLGYMDEQIERGHEIMSAGMGPRRKG